MNKLPLFYVLHSGKLFGTERMALGTLQNLPDTLEPILVAPPDAALEEAARLGIRGLPFHGKRDLARQLRMAMKGHRWAGVMSTGVAQVAMAKWAALRSRTRVAHLHVVHGGSIERHSYGRKWILDRLGVRLVAVSDFVRERLEANGVRRGRVAVVENSIPLDGGMPPRKRDTPAGRRVALVARADPIKRIDVLLDALARFPEACTLNYDVYGNGPELEDLEARARARSLPVHFHGFVDDVPARLLDAELLLHTCPEEPFGLAILEAMRAGIPVLVPDRGGTANIVRDGVTGYCYPAADAHELGRVLASWAVELPADYASVVEAARKELRTRFHPKRMAAAYVDILHEELQRMGFEKTRKAHCAAPGA